MITKIEINGFKSFHNFEMEFKPFTVIAGENASGKSNLFDVLKLLGDLMESDVRKAFNEQRGEFIELFTQYSQGNYATRMEFAVEMLLNQSVSDRWGRSASLTHTRLRYELHIERTDDESNWGDLKIVHEHLEQILPKEDVWIKKMPATINDWIAQNRGQKTVYLTTQNIENIPTATVKQDLRQGRKGNYPLDKQTVISAHNQADFPHLCAAWKEMRQWMFLQINPQHLRMPTSKIGGSNRITETGENLASVLHQIKEKDSYLLRDISRTLQRFAPHFTDVDVIDDHEGRRYIIQLKDKDNKTYTSRVLSEGTLRILVLCVLKHDEQYNGLLCFEEPENGLNPLRIGAMVNLLKELTIDFSTPTDNLRQVIVNTHSPVFVGKALEDYFDSPMVSVYFSQITALVIPEQKRLINITKMSLLEPRKLAEQDNSFRVEEEASRKYIFSKMKSYLEAGNFEQLQNRL